MVLDKAQYPFSTMAFLRVNSIYLPIKIKFNVAYLCPIYTAYKRDFFPNKSLSDTEFNIFKVEKNGDLKTHHRATRFVESD